MQTGKSAVKDKLEELGLAGRIILKWRSKKHDVRCGWG
jgi:hypothetical protein